MALLTTSSKGKVWTFAHPVAGNRFGTHHFIHEEVKDWDAWNHHSFHINPATNYHRLFWQRAWKDRRP